MKTDTKRFVLHAAREVVASKGFDCSLREISNASEVSYGHIHRTWETKELLMEDAEKLLHAVRGRLKKFENPRFSSGSLGKIPVGHAICTTDVYINAHGNIVNDWLLPDGRLMTIDQENVKKR